MHLVMMLHNTKNETFHPIMFRDSPMPGEGTGEHLNFIRFKSIGHHTTGFKSKEIALHECSNIKDKLVKHYDPDVVINTEDFIEWDGEGSPASVIFRNKEGTN